MAMKSASSPGSCGLKSSRCVSRKIMACTLSLPETTRSVPCRSGWDQATSTQKVSDLPRNSLISLTHHLVFHLPLPHTRKPRDHQCDEEITPIPARLRTALSVLGIQPGLRSRP